MALGCGLTSVRDNRGENYENEPLVPHKHTKKKEKKKPPGVIDIVETLLTPLGPKLKKTFKRPHLFKPTQTTGKLSSK
jgi:hypothetical protein